MEPEKIAHLELVQGVVSRMASNGLAVKSLAVTVTAAVVAISASQGATPPGPTGAIDSSSTSAQLLALCSVLPIGVFWVLDAYYLRIERAFRCLYDAIRTGADVEPFSMRVEQYKAQLPSTLRIALSTPAMVTYLVLALLLILVAVVAA